MKSYKIDFWPFRTSLYMNHYAIRNCYLGHGKTNEQIILSNERATATATATNIAWVNFFGFGIEDREIEVSIIGDEDE